MLRSLFILTMLFLSGCLHHSRAGVLRYFWADVNTYNKPAIIFERLDHYAPPANTVRYNRWLHEPVSGYQPTNLVTESTFHPSGEMQEIPEPTTLPPIPRSESTLEPPSPLQQEMIPQEQISYSVPTPKEHQRSVKPVGWQSFQRP